MGLVLRLENMSIFKIINDLILGDFLWTVLGAGLTLMALAITKIINRKVESKWVRWGIGIVLVGLFVCVGHELADPLIHSMREWYITPLGPSLQLK